jgi:hypothetical protein
VRVKNSLNYIKVSNRFGRIHTYPGWFVVLLTNTANLSNSEALIAVVLDKQIVFVKTGDRWSSRTF